MTVRVMSYNIRLGIQRGLDAVARVIVAQAPELVAVQEIGRRWTMGPPGDCTAELAALCGLPHYVFVPSLTRGAAHYGHALLSAHPIVAAAWDTLPQDVDEPRTLLQVRLAHPDGLLRVVSTHLSHIGDRAAQAPVLVAAVDESPEIPTLVMGDLNATADEPFIAELRARLVDADPGAQPTFPAHAPAQRIDYIFARDGALDGFVRSEETEPSDHLAIAATWTL